MPLVTVKQPDGSYAKITLEEFVRRQKNASTPSPTDGAQVTTTPTSVPSVAPSMPPNAPPSSVAEEKMTVTESVPSNTQKNSGAVSPQQIPPTAPSMPRNTAAAMKENQAFMKDMTRGLPERVMAAPVAQKTTVTAESIMAKLSFSVSEEFTARLKNCIELRVKEVRNDDQTKQVLVRSYDEGGLALNAAQVEEVLKLCAVNEQVLVVPSAKPLATSAPVNTFKHDVREPLSSVHQVVREEPYMPLRGGAQTGIEQLAALKPKPRPIVTDVVYKPMAIGPVEEIRTFSLTDFRRLSPVARDAALRLEQKFVNLKGESIVLYMESLDAWRQSPLFQEFTDRLLYATLHRSTIDSVLSKTKTITSEEMYVLLDMEKHLTV